MRGAAGRARWAWAAAAVVALFLCFPQPLAGGVLDLGVVLAWLAPAALLAALADLSPRRAALWGAGIFWVAYSAILHWIYVVTVVYGHGHPLLGVIAPIGLALYIALFGGAFGAGHAWLARHGLASAWSAALLWAVLDHLRSFFLTGFPWATLGYAQHANPALLGLASFTGVYGLSFASVLGSAAALEWWRARAAGRPAPLSARSALAATAGLLGLGLVAPTPEPGPSLRVAVVQGNVDQGVKWSQAWRERTLAGYERQTREAVAAGAELVVWPETAVPGALEAEPALAQRIAALARDTGAALVVGGVGVELDSLGQPRAYYDSAYSFDADGDLRDRYDKSHLVPFGEYIPFQDLLGRVLSAVARGIATAQVTPGPAPRALEVELADRRLVRVGVPICYELLFPDLVRRFALDGGGALLGITNDAWYGRTGAPYQFFAITALRAAETGLWVARAANTGVSGFIDGSGRARDRTPIFEAAWRLHELPLHPRPERATFYVRHGDAFAWLCWTALAAHGAWILRDARRGRMREAPGAPPPHAEPDDA